MAKAGQFKKLHDNIVTFCDTMINNKKAFQICYIVTA